MFDTVSMITMINDVGRPHKDRTAAIIQLFEMFHNLDLEPTGVLFGYLNGKHIPGTIEHAHCEHLPPKLTACRCAHWHLTP
jgi:hypothetical protein